MDSAGARGRVKLSTSPREAAMIYKLSTATILFLTLSLSIDARQRGQQPAAPPAAKASAPIDLTGYWASVVTEDWRWRMLTPPKGDVAGVPLNPEGRRLAGLWDPAADEAAGNQCKAYGAGGIIRI